MSGNGRDAYAQTCDPNFEDVMEARATLEAMREVEMAQRIIIRPDSVLEYSCFDDRINELAGAADAMFSDNIFSPDLFNIPVQTYDPTGPYAGFLPTINATTVTTPGNAEGVVRTGPNPPPFPPGRLYVSGLDTALSQIVYASMLQFLLSNFPHVYVAGTFSGVSATPGVCDPMKLVWDFVRCRNFSAANFRTFGELAVADPRTTPVACNVAARSTTWTTTIAAAFPAPGATGGVIPIDTHLDKFVSSCASVEPIPTGVQVFRGAPPTEVFEGAVCPAAGCYYDGSAGDCKP